MSGATSSITIPADTSGRAGSRPFPSKRMTTSEWCCAVARRRRGGSLTAARVRSILTRFRSHLANRYRILEITPKLLNDVMRLANAHALRAYDAVQLGAAVELNGRYQTTGLGGITLVSADR